MHLVSSGGVLLCRKLAEARIQRSQCFEILPVSIATVPHACQRQLYPMFRSIMPGFATFKVQSPAMCSTITMIVVALTCLYLVPDALCGWQGVWRVLQPYTCTNTAPFEALPFRLMYFGAWHHKTYTQCNQAASELSVCVHLYAF